MGLPINTNWVSQFHFRGMKSDFKLNFIFDEIFQANRIAPDGTMLFTWLLGLFCMLVSHQRMLGLYQLSKNE